MRMLISEPEMIHTLTGIAREVARRISAVMADDLDFMSHEEVIEAVERRDPETYVAMMQHLNAYRAWWENHRWLVDMGASGQMNDEQRRKLEAVKLNRDKTRSLLRERVVQLERVSRR